MLEGVFVYCLVFFFVMGFTPWLIRNAIKSNIVGRDMSKLSKPKVAEMGGLVIVGGFIIGVLFIIACEVFLGLEVYDVNVLLACLSTVLIISIIGIIDDMFSLNQRTKAILPIIASLPLMVMNIGTTSMHVPLFGMVNFGLFYPLILIPMAITGASNATNMLAGLNGLEAGLGILLLSTTAFVGFSLGSWNAFIISISMLAALLAFINFNWYPARIFIGDVGTLSIGAVLACAVIVGNFEQVGLVLFVPYFLELVLKARGRFKVQSWSKLIKGKLYCNDWKDVCGITRLVMYISKGISEEQLVWTILKVEGFFVLLSIVTMPKVLQRWF